MKIELSINARATIFCVVYIPLHEKKGQLFFEGGGRNRQMVEI
jgi:hypothetical protein